ncbi:MAG: AAA family ATPase [Fuerstiella sp.]|nr:AAA family ATPase [Fuerstiella sp.]
MYEHRFGLHRKPFQSALTENDFFESETHREIIPAILHALRSDLGVAVLTGPAGCGKTVTAEFLRHLLQADSQTVFLRGGAVRSASALLHSLHRSLKNTSTTDDADISQEVANNVRRWDILERLQRVSDFWGPIVVLLDDAHLVEQDVFAELRSLLEEETGGRKLLRLLITGPLSLEETLAQPSMIDFAQRIRTHVFLQPLRSDESVRYLDLQISNSGGTLGSIFEPEAVERIAAAADGSPRCLSLLADECLVVCNEMASRQQAQSRVEDDGTQASTNQLNSRVSAVVVTEALQRLQHLPYAWNASAYVDDQEDGHEDVPVTESSVEFISSGDSSSSNGVIEIGSAGESASSATTSSSASEGVVEIGFGAPSADHSPVDIVPRTSEALNSDADETPFRSADADLEPDSCETDDLPVGTVEISSVKFFDRTSEYPEFEPNVPPKGTDDNAIVDTANAETSAVNVTAGYDDTRNDAMNAPAATFEGGNDHDDASDLQSLEHHLGPAGGPLTSGGKHEKYVEADVTLAPTAVPVVAQSDTAEELFSHYLRWKPAGRWPAPSATRARSTGPTQAEPVFDRYTWCELGRSVGPEQLQRTHLVETSLTPVWPPDISGVSPASSIPVLEWNEEQTESVQIHPVTAIAVSPVIDIDAPLPNLEAEYLDQSIDYVQQLIAEAAASDALPPGGAGAVFAEDIQESDTTWIDGQLMRQFEASGKPTENEVPADAVCMNIGTPIDDTDAVIELPSAENDLTQTDQPAAAIVDDNANDSDEQILLPISDSVAATSARSTEREAQESKLNTTKSKETDRLLTLLYTMDDVQKNRGTVSPGDSPTVTDNSPVDNSDTMTAQIASLGSNSPGSTEPPGHTVTSLPHGRRQTVQTNDEVVHVAFREDGYAPTLLNQARDRVISIIPAQEMLRPAAGAESVALPVPEPISKDVATEGQKDVPCISVLGDSLGTDVPEILPKPPGHSTEPRFAQLFTRLRQQRTSGI